MRSNPRNGVSEVIVVYDAKGPCQCLGAKLHWDLVQKMKLLDLLIVSKERV